MLSYPTKNIKQISSMPGPYIRLREMERGQKEGKIPLNSARFGLLFLTQNSNCTH